jgi:nitroreductase
VYVLNDKGAYAYEAESNRLRQVATGDVRAAAIGRPSAASAFTLLFSCDAAKLPAFIKSNAGMNTQLMHGNAGFAAQNAMLAAAALKLDSIVMYNLKAKDAAAALKLGPEEQPLFIVQFGWRR